MKRICVILFATLVVQGGMAGEPFFRGGSTDWSIHIRPKAGPVVRHAANELTNALAKISGVAFPVVTNDVAPKARVVVVGTLEHPAVQASAKALNLAPGEIEQVAVYTLGGNLYLAGNRPRGALYAVYSFLQNQLGVRWLWPGADGEFMPRRTEWELPSLAFHHIPVIKYRGFHLCGDWRDHELFREWMARNFINIHRHGVRREDHGLGFYAMWSSHNARIRDHALFENHPEYFAEIDGVRYEENICFSHPDVPRIIADGMAETIRKRPELDILSIYPSDNQSYCRCRKCATMDVSTAWFSFYNRLTDILKREFPDLKCATIAYQGFRDVPECSIRNTEFVEYASYMRCNTHPYGHPDCPRNERIMKAFLEWKATGLAIGNYAYEYDIFSRNRRFVPFLTVIDDAIKTSAGLGHVTMIPEILLSPKTGPVDLVGNVQNRLSIYLYARLLWDPAQDMREILRDWCRTAFGPAADAMFEYYMLMDHAWGAMSRHTGILGNALSVVDDLLAGTLREGVAARFAAADTIIGGINEPAVRERITAAVEREKVLFAQWEDLLRFTQPSLFPSDTVARGLLWWCGAPERELNRVPALRQAFTEAGWQFQHVTNGNDLVSCHEACDTFWLRHPNGPNKPPVEYWQEHLVPAVRQGATAIFASYWSIPLDIYFDDPSFKVRVVSTGKLPLPARRSVYVAPGAWAETPYNVRRRLEHKITPAYGFIPAEPDAWTILATAPRAEGEPYPYILTRKVGKGRVIVLGDNIPISPLQLLENLLANGER